MCSDQNNQFKKKPIHHDNHKPALTRRDLIARGFASGLGYVFTPGILSLTSQKLLGADCQAASGDDSTNPLPFMAIELAGGANLPGSNFMVGGIDGQSHFLRPGGYGSLGLPPDQEPSRADIGSKLKSEFGILMHPNSAFRFGLLSVTTAATQASVDAFILSARSDDDTQNNPHNCVYWIHKAGARGQLVHLIGNSNTDSGARAAVPAASFTPALRPTVVNNFNSAAGLVSANTIRDRLGEGQAANIMAAAQRMSDSRLKKFNAKTLPEQIRELVNCGYLKSIDNVAKYSGAALDPAQDQIVTDVLGATTTQFTADQGLIDRDFQGFDAGDNQSVTSIAKLVLDGHAGAGSVVLGGYDYHGQGRATQEMRDFEAGRAVGLALEMANLKGKNLAIYLYTDGGVSCGNAGATTNTPQAGNKPDFTSDSGTRSSAVMFVHKAGNKGRPILATKDRRQLGFFDLGSGNVGDDGTFLTANSPVNQSKLFVLNYLALLGLEKDMSKIVGDNPFEKDLAKYIMFKKL